MLRNLFRYFVNHRIAVGFILVALVTFCCFIQDLGFNFLEWDDNSFVVNNPNIHAFNFSSIYWAFTSVQPYGIWMPLTWISLASDYALWTTNPVGFHFTNDLLHSINAGLFFVLSLKLITHGFSLKNVGWKEYGCALLAALLFAIHPMRIESVVWVVERKDVLSELFGLLVFLTYLKYVECLPRHNATDRAGFFCVKAFWYWVTFVFISCAGLSKPHMVTLPILLLIIDWFPLKRLSRKYIKNIVLEKIVLSIPLLIVIPMNVYAHWRANAEFNDISIVTRFLIACRSIAQYIYLTIYPSYLSPFYPYPGQNIPSKEYALPVVVIFSITVGAVLLRRRYPAIIAGWLFYLIALLPTLGFMAFGATCTAARYTYFPSLSFALLFSVGILLIVNKFSSSRVALAIILCCVVLLLCYYGSETEFQSVYWKDDLSLWTRVLDLQKQSDSAIKNNWLAHSNIGAALRYNNRCDDAIPHLRRAIKINSNDDVSYVNLGMCYRQYNKIDLARAQFNKAIKIHPDNPQAYYQLIITDLYIGDCQKALDDWTDYERIDPVMGQQLAGQLSSAGCY